MHHCSTCLRMQPHSNMTDVFSKRACICMQRCLLTALRLGASSKLKPLMKNNPIGHFRSSKILQTEINFCLVVVDVMAALGIFADALETRAGRLNVTL